MPITFDEFKKREEGLLKQSDPALKPIVPAPIPTTSIQKQNKFRGFTQEEFEQRQQKLPTDYKVNYDDRSSQQKFASAAKYLPVAAKRGAARLAGQGARALVSFGEGLKEQTGDAVISLLDVLEPGRNIKERLKDPSLRKEWDAGVREKAGKIGLLGLGAAELITAETNEIYGERRKIQGQIQKFQEEQGQYSEKALKAREDKQYWDPAYLFEFGAVDVGGQLAMAVGANAVVPGSGLAILTGMEAFGAREDAMDRMRANAKEAGVDFDPHAAGLAANGEAIIVGAVTAVTERLPLGIIGEKGSKLLEKRIRGAVTRRLLGLGGATTAESIQEAVQGAATDLAQYYVENDDTAFDGFLHRRIEEAVLGGFGGAAASIGASTARRVSKRNKKQIDTLYQQMSALSKTVAGRVKLQELSEKTVPSRNDLKKAGIDTKINLSQNQRLAVAKAADMEMYETQRQLLKKVAGKPTTTETVPETDQKLVTNLIEKTDVDSLQKLGVTKDQSINLLKETWLGTDRGKDADLESPKMTPERVTKLTQLENAWNKTENIDQVVKESQDDGVVNDIEQSQAAVKRLIDQKERYTEALQTAKGKGDADTTEVYQRLVDQANSDLAKQSTMLQQAEGEKQTPARESEEPREPKKPITPPIARETGGFLEPGKIFNTESWTDVLKKTGDVMLGPVGKKKLASLGKKLKNAVISDLHPDIKLAQQLESRRLAKKSAELQQAVVDYQTGAKKAAGTSSEAGVSDKLANDADQYLKGNLELDRLPESMQAPTKQLREKIDELSKEALDSGAITGNFLGSVKARKEVFDELRDGSKTGMIHEDIVKWLTDEGMDPKTAGTVASVIRNDGLYLTRTFDAFEDATWYDRMPDSVRQNMIDLLRREDTERIARVKVINEHNKRRGKPEKKVKEPITDKQIETRMNKIINDALEASDMKVFMSGRLGKQNRAILKGRKDLSKEWRDFLGEVKNPVENAVKTGLKLANLIEKYNMMEQVRDAGLGKFLFEENDENRPTDAVTQIAKEGDLSMRSVAGLWTTPEIKEMFTKEPFDINKQHFVYRAFMALDVMSQRAKTAWSIQSHMRQITGNPLMLMANGNLQVFYSRESIWKVAMLGKGTEAQRKYFNSGVKRGLANEGIEYGMFNRMAKKTGPQQVLEEMGLKKTGPIPKSLESIPSFVRKQYGTDDTIYKFYAWEGEKQKYRKTGMFEDTPAGEEKLLDYTAKIVIRTNPTYSELPQIIQTIRNIPGFGMFMAFPAAQIVNAGNRAKLGFDELIHENPKVKAIGAWRLASQLLVYSLPYSLEKIGVALLGIDEEEWQAFRETQAPWARYSPLLPIKKKGNGKFSFINLGFVDPHTYFTQPIRAALEGASEGEFFQGLQTAAGQVFEPYLQETMASQATVDLMRNKTQYGSQIWEDNDTWGNKLLLGSTHAARGTIMPGALISGQRIMKGIKGEISKGGKEYNAAHEAVSTFTGIKIEDYDAKQSFSFAARDYKKGIDSSRKVINSLRNQGTLSESKITSAIERSDSLRQIAVKQMYKDYENYHLVDPDINKGYLYNELQIGRRLSDDEIEQAYTGILKPYIPKNLDVFDRMISVATGERKKELEAAKEVRLNEFSYLYGDEETDEKLEALKYRRTQLDAQNIGSKSAIRRMISKIRADELERFVRNIKLKVGDKYPDEEVLKTAVKKQQIEGFKWTRARTLRAQRIGRRMGLDTSEIATLMEEAKQ